MGDVGQVVRNFIVDNFLFGQVSQFNDEDSFLENGLIDSMGILTLVEFVTERFNIPVADEEILPDNWDSITRISRFVACKQAAAVHGGRSV